MFALLLIKTKDWGRRVKQSWRLSASAKKRQIVRRSLLFLWCICPPIFAGEVDYKLKRLPLAEALTQFADQSNLQIFFRSQDVAEQEVGPLEGSFSPEDALTQLLQGTHLQYTFGGRGAVVIQPQRPAPSTTPPDDEAPAAPPVLPMEEMLVTGMRGSIWRNLVLKRETDAILDAMSAEDVGTFPDKNAADSLQRIPGVSVDRIWGEGRDIYIRGTDKDINRTLMNGQNVASAYWWANDNPSRGFNYTILASELISSLVVYKSPEADVDEGSIGGTVIIYTHKPFDMESKSFRLSLEGQYSQLPDAWDPQLSWLGSWKNSEETFGVLASFSRQQSTMRRDGLEAFPDNSLYSIRDQHGAVTDNVYVIWGGGSAIFQQQRERQTSNVTLQWQALDTTQLVFNYVDSSMDMDISNQNYLFVPGGFKLRESPPVTVINPRFGLTGNGRQILLGGTMENPDSTGAVLDAIFRDAYVDSSVYDLDIKHHLGDWELHSQLGVTRAQGGSNRDFLYRFEGNTREQFSLSSNKIEVEYLDLEPEDAASLPYFSAESHDWIRQMRDTEHYAQVDMERPLGGNFFTEFKTGIKWRDRRIENERSVGAIDVNHELWPQLQQTGLDSVSTGLTPWLHSKTASEGSLRRFAWVNESLAHRVFDSLFEQGVMSYSPDLDAFYRIDEDIGAAYGKLSFAPGAWRGNMGVRWVDTHQVSAAYEELELKDQTRRYRDFLPNLNLAYDISKNLVARASVSRVMARPTFQNLSSNIVIDGTSGNASGGNPDLEPFRAHQGDMGLEWYFSSESLVSATAFYKSISTYIYTQTQQEWVNDKSLDVTRPYNAEGARIAGVEFQWQQPLGGGFGWRSNYTYTQATVPSPDRMQTLKLPGNSRDQINASLYYEDQGYSLRFSYNYRSKSYGELVSGSQDETNAYAQWDFTAAWRPNDHLSFYAEGVNLTNEVIYYRTANNIPQGLYENGRRFFVGLRVRY